VSLDRLTLTTNFRSQAGLVSWFNASFPQILPPERDRGSGAVPYSPATPHPEKPALPGDPVTWHNIADRTAEAQEVIKILRKSEGRTAILVRKRDALAKIVPALKAAGIRYRAIEIEHLGEKQVVQDLYALTRALLHLGDRIAWLSLLRAPWLGLSLKKLFEIAGHDRFKTVWELIRDDLFLERFTRILAPAIANRERGSLRDRVEGVWLALGGPACVAGKTDLEDAEIYLDELEKLEEGGALHDPAALRESLERLYALPDVEATDDDLQIMTIHKAKGLEFGTVIVPGLDRGPGGGEPPLLLFKELFAFGPPVKGGGEPAASGGLLLAPIKATGSDKDPAYSYLRDLHTEAEDMEASRLLYVAATRAERRLHLLACGRYDDHGAPRPPTAHTLLARAWSVAEPFFSEAPAEPAREAPEPEAIYSINRLAPDFRMPPLPEPARWTSPPEGRDEEPPPFDWAQEPARLAGVVVHGWFQHIAEDGLQGWDAQRVERLRPQFGRELERRGVALTQVKRATGIVVASLKNALADERGRWILGPHPYARSELRIRTSSRKTMRIDRYIEDAQGVRWVVDFKTGEHRGADTDAFLDEQQKRYAKQLDDYAEAKQGARRALYFPLLRGWREW